MRSANRNVNRQPVRSPSPDIASKNKITNTTAPLGEVLKKSRINSHASMPLEMGMSSLEDLHRAVVDWEERYKILERQLNNLLLENAALKKEVVHLQELLAKNKPVFSQATPSQQNIKEYESRLSRMMDEIGRIQELLHQEKSKTQYLQNENDRLRYYQTNTPGNSNQYHNKFASVQQQLTLSFERMKAEMELKVRLSFSTLENRLANIEKTQIELENLLARSQFTTPKANKGNRSHGTSTAYYSPSPTDSKKFSRKSLPKQEERDNVLEQLSLENTRLRESLQKEKQKNASVVCVSCKLYMQRIGELEAEIESMKRERGQSQREAAIKNELELQHERFNFNIEDYLKRIREVKTILNNEEFREFIFKINQLINENEHLQRDLDHLHQERDQLEANFKKKEIEYKITVNSLSTQNQTLKIQVKQQEKQLSKLEQVIQTLKKAERAEKVATYRGSRGETDGNVFQRYIEEAILKLESLQQSMEATLRQ